MESELRFKIATDDKELEQIHRLNYRTFVEEILQHDPNQGRALVDKFHRENTYAICLERTTLVGMVAVRATRPFSLDAKLENLDAYLPPGCSPCEIRLLSVEKGYRHTRVFFGLMATLARFCQERGYDIAVISGTVRQLKLYRHIGFQPFGPLVGTPDALYQPMVLTLEEFTKRSDSFFRSTSTPLAAEDLVNLLPGPVRISRKVRQSFAETPVSHRSHAFLRDFRHTKDLLCQLVRAPRVQILTGSGTCANDLVAHQIARLGRPGRILNSGQFGGRLVDHATRIGLPFEEIRLDWGAALERRTLVRALQRTPGAAWLWACHCETSTGVLNNLDMLKDVCSARGVKLCLDCISSIGTVPVDLSGVYLASCVSGKAIRSFPGLSMVFYDHDVPPEPTGIPRYLDLGYYAANDGVPFTIPSNLIYALHTALKTFGREEVYDEIRDLSAWLRDELRGLGMDIVTPEEHASPAVVTFRVPEGVNSEQLGRRIEKAGYLLSYRSEYLLQRGWLQICLMGECSRGELGSLVKVLRDLMADVSQSVAVGTED